MNRYLAQCRVCRNTVEPGRGRAYRGGWAHSLCAPASEPQAASPYHGPVTIRAKLVSADPGKRRVAWWDGTKDGHRQVWTWLPKSLVQDNNDGTITIPCWLQHKTCIGAKELAERCAAGFPPPSLPQTL